MSAQMKETSTEIVEFNEFESKLSEFKEEYDNVVYDLTVPEQEKKARSDRYSIAKVISALDARHKEIKAPLKERVDLIDGERKRIKDQLLEVQDKIKSQIEAHEAAIREKEESLQRMVDEIRLLCVFQDDHTGASFTPDSAEVKRRLSILSKIDVDDSFEHRKADGTLAHVETKKALDVILAERLKYESEQAELERLRKEAEERERADREAAIRKEAEEKAKKEADERAERERRQAAEKAEKERQEAESKAKREIEEAQRRQKEAEEAAKRAAQVERERIEKERREQEAKAEAERKAEEAKKAKQNHRAKIHKAAKKSFMDNGLDESAAELAVTLIKDGKIQNVTVNY